MKILVCDPVSPKGIALLQQRPEFQVVVLPKRLSEAELLPVVADAVAMVVRSETKVTRKVIEAAPQFPGQAPASTQRVRNWGFALGHDWVIRPNVTAALNAALPSRKAVSPAVTRKTAATASGAGALARKSLSDSTDRRR